MNEIQLLTDDGCQIAADLLKDNGFDAEAEVLESPYMRYVGHWVAVFGPNYIWRGVLIGVTEYTLTMKNVFQIKNTDDGEGHGENIASEVYYTREQTFERSAVTNCGPAPWARPQPGDEQHYEA